MTAFASRLATAHTGAGAVLRRVRGLLRTDSRLLWRFQAVTATAVVTALWVVVLRVAPGAVRDAAVPFVLLTDVTALGFLFVPALLLLERTEGVEAAMRMTPVRAVERVGVRLALTTALSTVAAVAVCVAADVAHLGPRVIGVALLSMLFGLVAFALTGSATTLTTFLTRAPFVAAPLIAPALAHGLDVTTSPWLYASPVTGAVDMLDGDLRWGGVGWVLVCIAGVALLVGRTARRPLPAGDASGRAALDRRSHTRTWPAHPGSWSRWVAVRSFVRADRRTLLRDGLLLMLGGSVPLLALAMWAMATFGVTWAQRRYGVDLGPHLPVIEALLLVVHTPVVFGSLTGLLLLEDRDAGLFGPLATTRAGLSTLLSYRVGATAAWTAMVLAATLSVDGVGHRAGIAGTLATAVAAGTASVVPALLLAATAGNRVQGVAVMKMLGLPLYLPLVTWALIGPAHWAFAPLPTAWAMWTAWAPTPAQAVAYLAGAAVVSVGVSVPLARRFLRRAHTV